MTLYRLSPAQGRSPVSISQPTMPRLYRSLRPSRLTPSICSGAMYVGVPMVVPVAVSSVGASITRAVRIGERPGDVAQDLFRRGRVEGAVVDHRLFQRASGHHLHNECDAVIR